MSSILMINDSPSINLLLKSRLTTAGFSVETALTGEEGLAKAKASSFDLVLLDYSLPDYNGAQVCQLLKKEEAYKNTPIVIMSGKDKDEVAKNIKQAGANGFIEISFAGDELIENIKKYL